MHEKTNQNKNALGPAPRWKGICGDNGQGFAMDNKTQYTFFSIVFLDLVSILCVILLT